MEINNFTTGNIGEWSELYVLAYIIANQGLYGADENQEKTDIFYKVLKIIFNSPENKLQYLLAKENVKVSLDGEELTTINVDEIRIVLKKMLTALQVFQSGRAFELQSGNEMLRLLNKSGIKASSSKKKDIDLVLVDLKTDAPTPEIGFSIKSQLGSPSTLINASKATNFTFEVLSHSGEIPEKLPSLHEKNVKNNICKLLKEGYQLKFTNCDSDTFANNLLKIDSNLSYYLSNLLVDYYSRRGTYLDDLVSLRYSDNENGNEKHKIKEFLSTMALGMMPNSKWNGILTTLGGLILVKESGEVLCYYLYNLEEFQEYLLKNTKFETPSTTRYGIGSIFKVDDRFFIKLNLQVRFKK
jgi:type II restriction enzyme